MKKEISEIFSRKLEKLLSDNNMNASDLNRKSGVSNRMIGYLLKGERTPSIDIVEK